jgi:pectate lyase
MQANIKFMSVPSTDLYSAGLYFRYHSSNFYYFEILADPVAHQTYLEIAKIVDGYWFKISRVTLYGLPGGVPQIGVQYNLRVEIAGSTIRGYLNGALSIQTSDTTFASGQIGLYTFGCHTHFDDVIVSTTNP